MISSHMFHLTFVFFYKYARGRYALNGRVTFSGLACLVSPLPITRATGSCTRMFPFLVHVFSYLYQYGLSTRLLTFLLTQFSFCLVDSSLSLLFLDYDSLSTHFPFTNYLYLYLAEHYIYGLEMGLLPIFNLLCNHPKGVTCEIPCTLLVLSSSLAKATALCFLGVISSVYSLTGSEVQPMQCTSVRS